MLTDDRILSDDDPHVRKLGQPSIEKVTVHILMEGIQ